MSLKPSVNRTLIQRAFREKKMLNRLFGPRTIVVAPTTYTVLYQCLTGGTGGGALGIGDTANTYYCGLEFTESGSHTLTQLSVEMRDVQGAGVVGKTFTISLWTLNGEDLGTLNTSGSFVADSSSASWNYTEVKVPCSSFTTTNGVVYALVVDMGTTDGTNYARTSFTNPPNVPANVFPATRYLGRFKSNGVDGGSGSSNYCADFAVYTSP